MAPSVLEWQTDSPAYGLAFSPLSDGQSALRLAVGTFNCEPSSSNDVAVIATTSAQLFELSDDQEDERYGYSRSTNARVPLSNAFTVLARTQAQPYPASKVAFSPAKLSETLQNTSSASGERTHELIATTSDCLRIWDLVEDYAQPTSNKLVQRAVLTNVSGATLTFSCPATLSHTDTLSNRARRSTRHL